MMVEKRRGAPAAWAGVPLRAGWAPSGVLALHRLLLHSPWRAPLDGVLHFLGGCAAAYVIVHALRLTPVSRLAPGLLAFFAFTAACTVAVFWEVGECAGDRLRHTQLRMSLDDTMRDLVAGVAGAGVVCGMVHAIDARRARRDASPR